MRYDVLFRLELPGADESFTVIINVDLQNCSQLSYPLAAGGVSCVARQLRQQGPDHRNLNKVYSIWIVSNPPKDEHKTIVRYCLAETVDGPLEKSEADADFRSYIPQSRSAGCRHGPEDPAIVWLLDVLFIKNIGTDDKKHVLLLKWIPRTEGKKGREIGQKDMLCRLVRDSMMTSECAAEYAGTSVQQFQADMLKANASVLS